MLNRLNEAYGAMLGALDHVASGKSGYLNKVRAAIALARGAQAADGDCEDSCRSASSQEPGFARQAPREHRQKGPAVMDNDKVIQVALTDFRDDVWVDDEEGQVFAHSCLTVEARALACDLRVHGDAGAQADALIGALKNKLEAEFYPELRRQIERALSGR